MSDEEGNKKKLIIGGSIIGVCVLGLVYILFIKGDPAPTQEQTAAEIRAAEIQKAAETEAAKNPVTIAPDIPISARPSRGMNPAK